MAGIGVKLQKIYDRRTILANLAGFGYSTMVTIAPMFVVIGNVMLMSHFLGYETVGMREEDYFQARYFIFLYFPCWLRHRLMLYYRDICPILFMRKSTKISCHVMMSDYF